MNALLIKRIQELQSRDWAPHLRGIKRGFEKECLRVNKEGMIANTVHPKGLGSSLMHPMITTDYSEALLEFITPPEEDLNAPFNILSDLHQYTYTILKDEILWATSMPCRLPQENQIPIAEYGSSNLGKLKNIYRRGLGHRYGRMMQTIAGVHYNFSLSDSFWEQYQKLLQSTVPPNLFRSEQYLGLIRNCLRWGFILPLLFGASPAVCLSFFKDKKLTGASALGLERWREDTLLGRHATSLRMSDLGYQNPMQLKANISYNNYDDFLKTMQNAVHTSVPEYTRIGVKKAGEYHQLSDSILQAEDEHYALMRPKRVSGLGERMLGAILHKGIEYVEIRGLDINPFLPIGIEKETVYLMDALLIVCLLKASPPLTDAEQERIRYNQKQVAQSGRKPGLELLDEEGKSCTLLDLTSHIFKELHVAAELLDTVYQSSSQVFTQACTLAEERVVENSYLPSARVVQEIIEREESFFEFGTRWSLNHQKHFQAEKLSDAKREYYEKMAKDSVQQQKQLELSDTLTFDEYVHRFLEI